LLFENAQLTTSQPPKYSKKTFILSYYLW